MVEKIYLERREFPRTYRFFEDIIFPPRFITLKELNELIYRSQYDYHHVIGDVFERKEIGLDDEFMKIVDIIIDKIGDFHDIDYHDTDFHVKNEKGEYIISVVPEIDQEEGLKLYIVIDKHI